MIVHRGDQVAGDECLAAGPIRWWQWRAQAARVDRGDGAHGAQHEPECTSRARPVSSTRLQSRSKDGGIPDPSFRRQRQPPSTGALAESGADAGKLALQVMGAGSSPGAILATLDDPTGWGAQSGLSARPHERSICEAHAQMDQLSHVRERLRPAHPSSGLGG